MKILKEGENFAGLWIGKCAKCKAVVGARTEELSRINKADPNICSDGDFAWETCPDCKLLQGICFHRKGSRPAAKALEGGDVVIKPYPAKQMTWYAKRKRGRERNLLGSLHAEFLKEYIPLPDNIEVSGTKPEPRDPEPLKFD